MKSGSTVAHHSAASVRMPSTTEPGVKKPSPRHSPVRLLRGESIADYSIRDAVLRHSGFVSGTVLDRNSGALRPMLGIPTNRRIEVPSTSIRSHCAMHGLTERRPGGGTVLQLPSLLPGL